MIITILPITIEPMESKSDIVPSQSLADRMKQFETVYDNAVPNNHYLCIRLDGHGFSKFTKNLVKPFDINFSKAMIHSAYDCMCEFGAKTAYTQSDEITLIFDIPDLEKSQQYIFNGRIQKLLSLTASFVSTRFNHYLKKFISVGYCNDVITKINDGFAFFDSRILSFDAASKHEIANHIIWRCIHDCHRNAIQSYAYYNFGPHRISNLNGKQMIELLKQEKNISWNNSSEADVTVVPMWQKYGVFIKKELVSITSAYGESMRSKMRALSLKPDCSTDILDFLLSTHCDKSKIGFEITPYPNE